MGAASAPPPLVWAEACGRARATQTDGTNADLLSAVQHYPLLRLLPPGSHHHISYQSFFSSTGMFGIAKIRRYTNPLRRGMYQNSSVVKVLTR